VPLGLVIKMANKQDSHIAKFFIVDGQTCVWECVNCGCKMTEENKATHICSVYTLASLKTFAKQLGVRGSWHEPDEQGVTAVVTGKRFDNANLAGGDEKFVIIKQNGKPVFKINLAMLFAYATGYDEVIKNGG
jgi:hypothetical protein